MELNHLKYFYHVVRERSFTRASRSLRVQQPTISKMVRGLEEELDQKLLERRRDGVEPTAAGSALYLICEDIFGRVEEIRNLSKRRAGHCEGPLGFGATDSIASYLVPGVLGRFLRKFPDVRPSLFAGSSNLICSEIHDGKIEFGLFFTVPDTSGFSVTELAEIPFDLVIATKEAQRKEVRQALILSRDIDYPKSRPFPVLEMLQRNQVVGETFISCNNLDSQKELVKQGLGVSLLPDFMVREGLERGSLTRLHARREFAYSLKLVTRKGKVLSQNAEGFLAMFRESLKAGSSRPNV